MPWRPISVPLSSPPSSGTYFSMSLLSLSVLLLQPQHDGLLEGMVVVHLLPDHIGLSHHGAFLYQDVHQLPTTEVGSIILAMSSTRSITILLVSNLFLMVSSFSLSRLIIHNSWSHLAGQTCLHRLRHDCGHSLRLHRW
jgi:hypothetical protein